MTTLIYDFDPAGLKSLSEGLRSLSGEALGRAAIEAVNAVTIDFDKAQRRGQNVGINLTDDYISRRTHLTLATSPANPRAQIRTEGALTILAHYGAVVRRDPEGRDRRGRRLGKKQAGVSVTIKRGAPEYHFSWFTMKLKNSGQTGVFVREDSGKTKHLYGVSPYSLARFQTRQRQDDLVDDLATRGAASIADAIERALP